MTEYFVVEAVDGALKNTATGKFLTRDPEGFWRESDAASVYEKVAVNGSFAVYNPVPPDGSQHPEAFLYWPEVPNV